MLLKGRTISILLQLILDERAATANSSPHEKETAAVIYSGGGVVAASEQLRSASFAYNNEESETIKTKHAASSCRAPRINNWKHFF